MNGIIERVGDTEVLSNEDEINAGFAARDAMAGLSAEGRIRVLSWVASSWDIPRDPGRERPATTHGERHEGVRGPGAHAAGC